MKNNDGQCTAQIRHVCLWQRMRAARTTRKRENESEQRYARLRVSKQEYQFLGEFLPDEVNKETLESRIPTEEGTVTIQLHSRYPESPYNGRRSDDTR